MGAHPPLTCFATQLHVQTRLVTAFNAAWHASLNSCPSSHPLTIRPHPLCTDVADDTPHRNMAADPTAGPCSPYTFLSTPELAHPAPPSRPMPFLSSPQPLPTFPSCTDAADDAPQRNVAADPTAGPCSPSTLLSPPHPLPTFPSCTDAADDAPQRYVAADPTAGPQQS